MTRAQTVRANQRSYQNRFVWRSGDWVMGFGDWVIGLGDCSWQIGESDQQVVESRNGPTRGRYRSQPASSCFWCAVIALRMNMATVTGPTPPGTGVTQLATSFTLSVSTSPTIMVSPLGPVT